MDETMTIEQANILLEETVGRLENENLPVGESVALYTKACDLIAYCMEQLNDYKGRIEDANQRIAAFTEASNG